MPHGVLFRGGEEGKIRKALIEYNHIDTIIGLPANIFFGTGIPTIIMVLRQEKKFGCSFYRCVQRIYKSRKKQCA